MQSPEVPKGSFWNCKRSPRSWAAPDFGSSLCKNPQSKHSAGHIAISNLYSDYDYSMILATVPDSTVRPPSRYQTDVLQCANGDFSCDLWGKIWIFHCVRVVFGDFVIMVLS